MLYRFEWDMWFAMSLIGVTVGIVGFMMHETVAVITHYKWTRAFFHIQVCILLTPLNEFRLYCVTQRKSSVQFTPNLILFFHLDSF